MHVRSNLVRTSLKLLGFKAAFRGPHLTLTLKLRAAAVTQSSIWSVAVLRVHFDRQIMQERVL